MSLSTCFSKIIRVGPPDIIFDDFGLPLHNDRLKPGSIVNAERDTWINVDGFIDIPGRDVPFTAEEMLKPEAIAETYWHVAHQDRSAWTAELEVRPFKEKF